MQQGESSSYPAQPPPPPPPPQPDPVPLLGGVPASPISSRPPPALAAKPEDIAPHANFPDDDFGDRSISGGGGGNRWPRQETLALLKIRSDMDAAFRDATLKAPLWEAVSRKLAELGYKRSAKKCKEKFENVHKYYKRTKEGRAGRQDGKSYRFFDQLEALHGAVASASSSSAPVAVFAPAPAPAPAPIPIMSAPTPIAATAAANPLPIPAPSMPASAAVGAVAATPTALPPPPPPVAPAVAGVSYSSHTSSSEASESDEDEGGEGRKRKRGSGGGGGGGAASPEMLSFMEGLMRQVMERQETMQQRFLEAIEKREQDRMVREEAWRRQEMLRLNREHDLLVQERAAAASRDAAIVAFLQKMTGQNIQLPPQLAAVVSASAPPPPSPFQPQQRPSVPLPYHHQPPPPQPPAPPAPQQQQQPSPRPQQEPITPQHQHHHQPPPTSSELVAVPDLMDVTGSGSLEPISSRWPKVEVHALINLRSSLELRYQEAGPKGPLWEEISSEMRRLGYNRSAKRCKEKWENINKYFKKVKESNKKRPEDAKTCPYFHQLDALYRQKHHHTNPLPLPAGAGSGFMITQRPHQEINPSPNTNPAPTPQETTGAALAIMAAAAAPPPPAPRPETDNKSGGGGNGNGGNGDSSGSGAPSNGGLRPPFFDQGTSSDAKPEDIAKELMKLPQSKDPMDDYDNLDDHMDDEDDDDDDDDDDDNGDRKLQYRVQFQNSGGGGSGGGGAPPPTGSFLAMV